MIRAVNRAKIGCFILCARRSRLGLVIIKCVSELESYTETNKSRDGCGLDYFCCTDQSAFYAPVTKKKDFFHNKDDDESNKSFKKQNCLLQILQLTVSSHRTSAAVPNPIFYTTSLHDFHFRRLGLASSGFGVFSGALAIAVAGGIQTMFSDGVHVDLA